MDIWLITLSSIIALGIVANIIGFYVNRRVKLASEEDDELASLADISELEGRLEALERRMRSLSGHTNATKGKKNSTSTRSSISPELEEFLQGVHPDELAKYGIGNLNNPEDDDM